MRTDDVVVVPGGHFACTYNQPETRRIPEAPVTMVKVLQSRMAYAKPAKAIAIRKKPVHTKPPVIPLWRTPENSVNSTNNGMLYAPREGKKDHSILDLTTHVWSINVHSNEGLEL